jgi:hypothetical protein
LSKASLDELYDKAKKQQPLTFDEFVRMVKLSGCEITYEGEDGQIDWLSPKSWPGSISPGKNGEARQRQVNDFMDALSNGLV